MSVDPVAISRTALDVEWQRLELIAQNLANENTTRVGGRGVYRPVELISGPAGAFGQLLEKGSRMPQPQGTRVLGIVPEDVGVRRVHDPHHPDADGDGFVTYPAIDHAREMTELVKTARIYESNLTVMALAEQMSMRALDIGKS